jgi:arabinogalactan endo-1,4-beta-galactosidase
MFRKELFIIGSILLLIVIFSVSVVVFAQQPTLLINPDFEADGTPTSDPTGWNSTGDTNADFTEWGGLSGEGYRLTHWSSSAYIVETWQTVTGLDNETYTLRAWLKSGGEQNEAYIALKNCGSPEERVDIPQTSPTVWEQIEVSIEVTNGQCTVSLYSDANAGNWINFDDLSFAPASQEPPTSTPTPTPTPTPIPSFILVQNSGFEAGDLTGWNSTGDTDADFTEWGGRTGNYRLSHWSADPYTVETWQTVTGLSNGWYTLRAWVKSGGGQNEAYIALKNCGSPEETVAIPTTSPDVWEQLKVSIEVTNSQCTISLYSDANAGNWVNFDDVELVSGRLLPIRGADISSLKKSEDLGGVYRDENGDPDDALEILADHGLNYIRLRVWVDPADGYHTQEQILPIAQRAKNLGMKLLVDFHYSDRWADPGHQTKPAAWADLDFEGLKAAVYDHTFDVCSSLAAQGTPPDMVQLGNEINGGMLWPDADWEHWDNLADLLKEGARAVKDCSSSTQIMLHIANGGDNGLARWWFDNAVARDVPFDVMGISYYPYWHGQIAELQYNLNDITAYYDKDVVLVEFAYPFTLEESDFQPNIVPNTTELPSELVGFPATPAGQTAMTQRLMDVVRAVPNDRGLGVFWWDATWTVVPGNGWDPEDPNSGNEWENQALFDYDDQALPAMSEFIPVGNHSPDVSEAAPTRSTLWPPNHKMVDIEIVNVTDPDGDPVSLIITAITQDEPVRGGRYGWKAPDGIIVDPDTAQLRAERDGRGNGRVYEIHFVARDNNGGKTSGSVSVCVPRSRRHKVCVDDGQNYDSTYSGK